MKPTPKTIQIFLPGGDPRGIRIAEITTRIVQVIEVPRSLVGEFAQMPESDQVALHLALPTGNTNEGIWIAGPAPSRFHSEASPDNTDDVNNA